MNRITRRRFVKSSLAAGAAFAIGGTKSSGQIIGSNETILIGVAGINGRGKDHIAQWLGMKDVRISHLIDIDSRLFKGAVQTIEEKSGRAPQCVQDIRKALEDKDLDAISIATPNHWHALMTIWACQAGKDVYVEKPLCHNVHEGRIAVQTARKYNRIVQQGTQGRSGNLGEAIQALCKSGKYGKLLIARGTCYKRRDSIGFKEPKEPPKEIDFDIWLGPAPLQPYHENLVHYNWHWFWDFGNGDIGNQGVHEMDKARWGIPGAILPKSVVSVGGRFGYKDQGQTANTQIAVLDYGGTQLIFEVRGLPRAKGAKEMDTYYEQGSDGNLYHFEKGIVAPRKNPKGDQLVFYPDGKGAGEVLRDVQLTLRGDDRHFRNFIEVMRSRKVEDLRADVEVGFYSCVPIHLANASYRLGEEVPFTTQPKVFEGNAAALETLERMAEHLKKNEVKLEETMLRVGPKLMFDAATEKFTGPLADKANELITRKYRPPYLVPDKVA
ncbi:MAG: Gfo/Idh/MocA family oxidoreductase [Candidatus Sumerlaeia bacterium]|nr:Gfo/Idh/MocA family oxidoreductase [Candidatus Sumerlaeia bacterium]